MQQRAERANRPGMRLAGAALLAFLFSAGTAHPSGRPGGIPRVVVGHPCGQSFPSVAGVTVTSGGEILRVWRLSSAALRLAAALMPVSRATTPKMPVARATTPKDAAPLPLARLAAANGATPALPAPDEPASQEAIPLTLMEGRSRIVPATGLRTVQIDDSEGAIAEVQPISDKEVLVLAKGVGTTTVRIWDARGRIEYEVTVEPSPARRQKTIAEAIAIEGVTVRVVDGAALLEGEVSSVEQLVRAQRIAEAFVAKVVNLLQVAAPPPPGPREPSLAEQVQAVLPPGEVTADSLPGQPTTVVLRGFVPHLDDMKAVEELARKVVAVANGTVVNLIQLAEPRQVRVQARMVSVDERLLKELGVEWNDQFVVGQAAPGGSFRALTALQANIQALLENAESEVLAAPSIVVNSGASGNIMIGGELPLPTVVTGVTDGTQTGVGTIGQGVIFRPFGIQLNIEPVVEPGEAITLRLAAESSTVDRTTAVQINGASIPGFSTKRATTELRLKGGETLVIGGLISKEDAEAVRKFPILADIPVLGRFFQSVRKEKQARELVIFLTPELLPGPEPPAGLRQTPPLRPDTTAPRTGIGLGSSVSGTSIRGDGQSPLAGVVR